MNTTGGTFGLSWDAPPTADQVDYVTIFEHMPDGSYVIVQMQAQPANITTLTGVGSGVHAYVAKAHNAAGDSANYSNEVAVTVLALPAAVQNLVFAIQGGPATP